MVGHRVDDAQGRYADLLGALTRYGLATPSAYMRRSVGAAGLRATQPRLGLRGRSVIRTPQRVPW